MARFYGASHDELMSFPIGLFWLKYKNMEILKLQDRIVHIVDTATAASPQGNDELFKLKWRLEQLTEESKPQKFSDETKKKHKRGGRPKKKKPKKKKLGKKGKFRHKLLLKKF